VRKISKKTLKNKADKLFSLLIRKRGTCEMCGQDKKDLQCAHVITRSTIHLRYDTRNSLCLCSGCHLRWHHSPLWAITWYKSVYPENAKYLLKQKNVIERNFDYQEVIDKLKKTIHEVELNEEADKGEF
jgi:hypothetical protein